MVRIFIAIEPSAELRHALCATKDSLSGTGKLTLVSAEQMHITLKFLGEIPETILPRIQQTLNDIGTVQPAYRMKAAKISTFGHPPRIIKAEIEDNGASQKLAAEIDNRLSTLGFSRDEKPFSPHITLARIKECTPELMNKIQEIKAREFGSCEIHELFIKKSVLTPKGPIYSTIYRISL